MCIHIHRRRYFAPISALKEHAPKACAMLHRAFDVTPVREIYSDLF